MRIHALCILGLVCLTACTTVGGTGRSGSGGNVSYGDSKAVETVTTDFGSTDLQNTAEQMTQSLLESRYIVGTQSPPKIRLREVRNLTSEHIDTKAITDKIRIRLLKSGQVRFLADTANLKEVNAERDFTETSTKRTKMKAMTDSDYIVTGNVRSIKKTNKDLKDVYYLITMELVDPQSSEILWADEKEIRKTATKSMLGW